MQKRIRVADLLPTRPCPPFDKGLQGAPMFYDMEI